MNFEHKRLVDTKTMVEYVYVCAASWMRLALFYSKGLYET